MKGNLKYKGCYVELLKGILLEGLFGMGKMFLVKVVVGEVGLLFFYVNGFEFVEMFVGVVVSCMCNLFKCVCENVLLIIFIDEFDIIGCVCNVGE